MSAARSRARADGQRKKEKGVPKGLRAVLGETWWPVTVVILLLVIGLALHWGATLVGPRLAALAQLVGFIFAASGAVIEISQKDAKLSSAATWVLRGLLAVGLGLAFGSEVAEAVSAIR